MYNLSKYTNIMHAVPTFFLQGYKLETTTIGTEEP